MSPGGKIQLRGKMSLATFSGFLQAWKKQFVRKKWRFCGAGIIYIPPCPALYGERGLRPLFNSPFIVVLSARSQGIWFTYHPCPPFKVKRSFASYSRIKVLRISYLPHPCVPISKQILGRMWGYEPPNLSGFHVLCLDRRYSSPCRELS